MGKPTDLTWRDRLWHLMRFWCGMKLKRDAAGDVVVEMNCRVCMKNNVTPEAWERLNSRPDKEEKERQEALRLLDQMKVNNVP